MKQLQNGNKVHQKLRLLGVPDAYISGQIDFFNRNFKIDRRAYIPTKETEHLVEEVLKEIDFGKAKSIVDVGTGCGSIAITIKLERPKITVTGLDINKSALDLARDNASSHSLKMDFLEDHYVDEANINEPDLIVADLPYGDESNLLGSNSLSGLSHMPKEAIFHPRGVLKSYSELIDSIIGRGWKSKIFFETGPVKKDEVSKIIPFGKKWEYKEFPNNYSVTILDLGGRK